MILRVELMILRVEIYDYLIFFIIFAAVIRWLSSVHKTIGEFNEFWKSCVSQDDRRPFQFGKESSGSNVSEHSGRRGNFETQLLELNNNDLHF